MNRGLNLQVAILPEPFARLRGSDAANRTRNTRIRCCQRSGTNDSGPGRMRGRPPIPALQHKGVTQRSG